MNPSDRLAGAVQWQYPLKGGESGDLELEGRVVDALQVAFTLWQQRQRKYGRGNISSSQDMGCFIRASDKMARLKRYYLDGVGDMTDESVNDTWLDLLNYALMGYMTHNNLWETPDGTP